MKSLLKILVLILVISISLCLCQAIAQHSEFYGFSSNAIFKTDSNGNNLQIVYNFPSSFEGANPSSSLCKASNGKFYGITQRGGINGQGILFEWDPVTNIYSKKLDFSPAENGSGQFSSVIQADNGKFYGMTSTGGADNFGVLFEWNLVTNVFIKKLDFNGADNGRSPEGSLMQADNGKIYGMTTYGGIYSYGAIFEWDLITGTISKKLDFNGVENGSKPVGNMLQGINGKLYGMTSEGGLNNNGVIFEWDHATNTCIKKIDFNPENGRPTGSMIFASNGKLYGGTRSSIFEWDPATNT
jgi:uncharacterized repeat protein (TIGR03803 family)